MGAEPYPPLRSLVVYLELRFRATNERKKSLTVAALSDMSDIRPQDWRPLTLRRINLGKAKDRDGPVILLDTDIPSTVKQRSDGRRSEFEVDGPDELPEHRGIGEWFLATHLCMRATKP